MPGHPPNVHGLAVALHDGVGLLAYRLKQAPMPGGLSPRERSALSRLQIGGPATAADLARAEQISPQAVSTTLAALERRGLIERRPDPDDGRQVIMSLTPAGVEVLRHKRDARTQRVAATLAQRFTAAELATLAAAAPLIQRLADNI